MTYFKSFFECCTIATHDYYLQNKTWRIASQFNICSISVFLERALRNHYRANKVVCAKKYKSIVLLYMFRYRRRDFRTSLPNSEVGLWWFRIFFIAKIKDCFFNKWYRFVYYEELYLIFWRNRCWEKQDHFLECDSVTKFFPFSRTILLHFSNFIFSYIPILFNRISKARDETHHAHSFPYSYAPEAMLFNRSLSVKKIGLCEYDDDSFYTLVVIMA